jgi:hypothetical protein
MPVTPTNTTRARDNTEKWHVFMFNAASALLSVEFAVRSVSLSRPAADITFWQCHCFLKNLHLQAFVNYVIWSSSTSTNDKR